MVRSMEDEFHGSVGIRYVQIVLNCDVFDFCVTGLSC